MVPPPARDDQSLMVQSGLLRSRRYGLFWVSSLFSNMGTWMQQVAQPWIVLSLNPSSFWVGLDSFALNAPGWIFTLWGGMLADRYDRKRIILFFQSVQAVCVLTLLILLLAGWLKIWSIVLLSFLIGATDAFSMPALQSIIPSIVEKKEIPRAVAFNSTQFNLSRVAGPALAGFVIATYGTVVCVSANLFSYLPFFLSIYWIYPKSVKPRIDIAMPTQSKNELLKLFQDSRVRNPLLSIFVTSLFCAQLITFCSVIIKEVFHAGVADLGWSTACFGIGGVLGAIVSSVAADKISASVKITVLIALTAGGIVILASQSMTLILFDIFLALAGLMLTLSNTSANSILQMSAQDSRRGQVASLFQLAMRAGISAGSLATGTMTATLGPRTAFLINGALAMSAQTVILVSLHRSKKRYP